MTKRPKALDTFPEGLWEEMKQVLLYHFGSFHLHPFRAPPDGGDFGQQLITYPEVTEEILQNLYAMLAFEHWHKGRLSTIVDNYCERFLDYLLMNMYDEDLQRTKEYRRLQRLSNRIADEYLLR